MKELKKVYGHFEILKKNAENNISKVTYSSLDKYSRSPYLQSTSPPTQKSQSSRTAGSSLAKTRPHIVVLTLLQAK